jgi:uncharacterized RDD family membrane protein YckC
MTDQELQKKRLIAAAIDIAIAVAIGIAFAIAGVVLGFAIGRASHGAGMYAGRILGFLGAAVSLGYILSRDVLAGGRSFGKQTQNIRVVTTAGQPITITDSAKRNLIFGISGVFWLLSATLQLVPCLGDAVACLLLPLNLLAGLATLAAGIVEIVKITQEPEGVRLGDQWADTRVTY